MEQNNWYLLNIRLIICITGQPRSRASKIKKFKKARNQVEQVLQVSKFKEYQQKIKILLKQVLYGGHFNVQHLITSFNYNYRGMSFEVRQFEIEQKKGEFIWKFQLGKNSVSQVDFYAEQESVRSLYHLTQDISHQIESVVDRKKKKNPPKDRVIRKCCEKMIKSLSLTLKQFANDIGEKIDQVKSYFGKKDMSQQVRLRLQNKCQKWIIEAWGSSLWNYYIQQSPESFYSQLSFKFQMSLPPERFFKSSKKYLESLFKDGKKITPDFELLNQFYLIIQGDGFEPSQLEDPAKNDNMVLIDINLNVGQKYVSQSFLWNPEQNTPQKVNGFIQYFLTDLLFQNEIETSKEIFEQLMHECRVQLRSQALYKSLLKKHSNILLNFSTMEISQDLKQYLIEIELRLMNQDGQIFYEDSFEWDIMNQYNNVQQFCLTLIEDEEIPPKFFSQLCYKMKSQINAELEWKFTMLVKTFKAIHKDRQSPKLNTQTLTQLKKNIIYSMDVSLPNNPDKSKISSSVYLNNSDLFSTLSRNFDILPEQFQEILQCKQTNRASEMTAGERTISKQKAEQELKIRNYKMEENKYIGNFTNSYKMHSIWKQSLESQVVNKK